MRYLEYNTNDVYMRVASCEPERWWIVAIVAVESVLWSRYVLSEAGAGEMRGRLFCKL